MANKEKIIEVEKLSAKTLLDMSPRQSRTFRFPDVAKASSAKATAYQMKSRVKEDYTFSVETDPDDPKVITVTRL